MTLSLQQNKNILIKFFISIVFTFIFFGCQTKSGDSGGNSSAGNSSSTNDTYTTAESTRILSLIESNRVDIRLMNNNTGIDENDYTTVTSNILVPLNDIVSYLIDNSVPTTYKTLVKTGVNDTISSLNLVTNENLTVIEDKIDVAINSYGDGSSNYENKYNLVSSEVTTLNNIKSSITDIQSQISLNESNNPYYAEIYDLYFMYYKDTNSLDANQKLLKKVDINLSDIDDKDLTLTKMSIIKSEITEFQNSYGYEGNGIYPDNSITSLINLLNNLYSTYENYYNNSITSTDVEVAVSQFRANEYGLFGMTNGIYVLSSSVPNSELNLCTTLYSALKNLNSSTISDNKTAYDTAKAILDDFEDKREYYYGLNGFTDVGTESYNTSSGNNLFIASMSINVITTYRILYQKKATTYKFLFDAAGL